MRKRSVRRGMYAILGLLVPLLGVADTVTWSGNGLWTSGSWAPHAPNAGDVAVISSGNCTVDVATVALATLTNNGTLVFTGDVAKVTATEVIINGTVRHSANTATNTPWTVDGQVWFVCTNFTLAATGLIDGNSRGYRITKGPGKGTDSGAAAGGGGYGGAGGTGFETATAYGSGGSPYGITNGPVQPGSGGGDRNSELAAGPGGGLVRIEATGAVTLDGTIQMNGGGGGNRSGAGSGGGINIACQTLSGTGLLQANGGDASTRGGGGGGGRIALSYNPSAQSGVSPQPTLRLAASGGYGGYWDGTHSALPARGQPGTIWLTDTTFYPVNRLDGGMIVTAGFTNWAPANLTITNNGFAAFEPGFVLNVASNLQIFGTGGLLLSNMTCTVGGSLRWFGESQAQIAIYDGPSFRFQVDGTSRWDKGFAHFLAGATNGTTWSLGGDCLWTNGALLEIQSGATNGVAASGARLSVGGDLTFATNSRAYVYSHPTNGGSCLIQAHRLTVAAGATIDADAKGFSAGYGPGKSTYTGPGSGGAGYGGDGGLGARTDDGGTHAPGGPRHGSSNAPALPGSGAGSGGSGAGLLWAQMTGPATVNGTLTATGGDGGNRAGGGSGGGIYLTCRSFSGNGTLKANGGNGGYQCGGGGGGGRIAVWAATFAFGGTTNVNGGLTYQPPPAAAANTSSNGFAGTVVFGALPPRGTVIVLK